MQLYRMEKNQWSHISVQHLKAKIERRDDFVLVGSLSERSCAAGHMPGAINIPSERIDDLAATLIPNRHTDIVVYCGNGQCAVSEIAAEKLLALRYRQVRTILGGRKEWTEAGYPLDRSAQAAA